MFDIISAPCSTISAKTGLPRMYGAADPHESASLTRRTLDESQRLSVRAAFEESCRSMKCCRAAGFATADDHLKSASNPLKPAQIREIGNCFRRGLHHKDESSAFISMAEPFVIINTDHHKTYEPIKRLFLENMRYLTKHWLTEDNVVTWENLTASTGHASVVVSLQSAERKD